MDECCHLHGPTCEPPSELCCEHCTEVRHPNHSEGEICALSWDWQRYLARTRVPNWIGPFGANIPEEGV